MDISGVQTPAVAEVQTTPPRDAQLETAVRETSQSEAQQNATGSDSGGDRGAPPRDESSTIGRHIDERA